MSATNSPRRPGKIHFKEVDARGIYGEATKEEVAALVEDGVDFMPLPSVKEEHN